MSRKVISSPKMLSKFSPVASIIKRTNSCKRISTPDEESKGRVTKLGARKSTFVKARESFSQFPKKLNLSPEREREREAELEPTFDEDFSTAMNEESQAEEEVGARKIPCLKVNSNDLHWLKEQKCSKDVIAIKELNGEAVRVPRHQKKMSQFFIPKDTQTEEAPRLLGSKEDIKEVPPEASKVPSAESVITVEVYCECGNLCETDNSLCASCRAKQKPIDFAGELFVKIDETNTLCWVRLLNKELYCTIVRYSVGYKEKDDPDFIKFHQLSGLFVKKEEQNEEIRGVKVFPITLNEYKMKRTFYALTEDDREAWLTAIRSAIGYSNLFLFYDIKVLLPIQSFRV
jgi:hypothetical protein